MTDGVAARVSTATSTAPEMPTEPSIELSAPDNVPTNPSPSSRRSPATPLTTRTSVVPAENASRPPAILARTSFPADSNVSDPVSVWPASEIPPAPRSAVIRRYVPAARSISRRPTRSRTATPVVLTTSVPVTEAMLGSPMATVPVTTAATPRDVRRRAPAAAVTATTVVALAARSKDASLTAMAKPSRPELVVIRVTTASARKVRPFSVRARSVTSRARSSAPVSNGASKAGSGSVTGAPVVLMRSRPVTVPLTERPGTPITVIVPAALSANRLSEPLPERSSVKVASEMSTPRAAGFGVVVSGRNAGPSPRKIATPVPVALSSANVTVPSMVTKEPTANDPAAAAKTSSTAASRNEMVKDRPSTVTVVALTGLPVELIRTPTRAPTSRVPVATLASPDTTPAMPVVETRKAPSAPNIPAFASVTDASVTASTVRVPS